MLLPTQIFWFCSHDCAFCFLGDFLEELWNKCRICHLTGRNRRESMLNWQRKHSIYINRPLPINITSYQLSVMMNLKQFWACFLISVSFLKSEVDIFFLYFAVWQVAWRSNKAALQPSILFFVPLRVSQSRFRFNLNLFSQHHLPLASECADDSLWRRMHHLRNTV